MKFEAIREYLTNPTCDPDRWLVPVYIKRNNGKDIYQVDINYRLTHYYDEQTIPDFVAQKLGAIGAFTVGKMDKVRNFCGNAIGQLSDEVYFFNKSLYPKEFETIGWRCSEDMFMMSLSEHEFDKVLSDAGI